MGKVKREVLMPQYIRNTVNNSEVACDTFTDGCLKFDKINQGKINGFYLKIDLLQIIPLNFYLFLMV